MVSALSAPLAVPVGPTRLSRGAGRGARLPNAEIKLIIISLFLFAVWSESVAIYVAVIIVSGVSAFVDWRKEKEFVKRSQSEEDSKFVSTPPSHPYLKRFARTVLAPLQTGLTNSNLRGQLQILARFVCFELCAR